MKLNKLTLASALDLLKKKQIKLTEIYQDIFQEIKKNNQNLNIYLTWDNKAVEKAIKVQNGALGGLPTAVKDNFLTREILTTASSKVLDGFMPPYESTVTQKIKNAGGVIIGKTNMDAWAHGSSTETSDYGPTKNPRNPKYLPGGSSGGSAAAVASDMCTFAIGSETAGSIRQPAAWCGCVGMKPTYGRVSRAGVVAMGSSLDCPGPITKTVEDAAIILEKIAGHDPYDATSSLKSVPVYTKAFTKQVKNMRIGICYMDHRDLKGKIVDKAVTKAAEVFERLGADIERVEMSDQLKKGKILTPDYAVSVYTVVQRAEVSSNLARYDGIRYGNDRSIFGEEAKRRIMLGTFTLSKGYADKYYVKAQQVRSLYIQNFSELFQKYDLLITSPSPGFALPLGASSNDPMFGELQDILVEPSSLAGLPGISIPCFTDKITNLSIGLNIMADQWQEEKIFTAAYAFEKTTDWNQWNVKK